MSAAGAPLATGVCATRAWPHCQQKTLPRPCSAPQLGQEPAVADSCPHSRRWTDREVWGEVEEGHAARPGAVLLESILFMKKLRAPW